MSFENFPYTNFHELNLDWIIQKVKAAYSPDNPPENIVISVNGETGEVVLYKDAIVRLPDVEEETWNIHRVADNSSSGIEFDVGNCAKRIDGTFRYPIYDAGNPPPYPVRSVNGQTGNVVITIPVTSVNGQTGAVTLYRNAAISFPDVSETTWNMYRGSGPEGESKITGIQFRKDNAAQRINGTDRYNIYDEGNPPPYPVTSVGTLTGAVAILDTTIVVDGNTQKLKITFPVTTVDGQTGTVRTWGYSSDRDIEVPLATEGDAWGLIRDIPSGTIGIDFEYDGVGDEFAGYITFRADGSSTTQKVKILTPADIPSSSGVVSINGSTGVVVLTAADIALSSLDSTKIDTLINANTSNIANIFADIADTWSDQTNYLQGAYVIHNGHLYKATTANNAGTWASQNWTSITLASAISANTADIAANASAISANTADIAANASAISAVGDMVADTYNPSTTYYKGAMCKKDGVLYKATAQTTGTWDSTKWSATDLAEQVVDKVDETVITATPEFTSFATENYSAGDYILISGVLHKAITNISELDTFSSSNVQQVTLGSELTSLNDHIGYKVGDTVSLDDVVVTATAEGSNKLRFWLNLPKRIPSGATATITVGTQFELYSNGTDAAYTVTNGSASVSVLFDGNQIKADITQTSTIPHVRYPAIAILTGNKGWALNIVSA